MSQGSRVAIAIFCVLLAAAGMFLPGLGWGLYRAEADAYLFGDQPPWAGEQILEAATPAEPAAEPAVGADVDANPLDADAVVLNLNADDAARAEIARRYRLFTAQPDEMITLMSLARMNPGELDLDPRLYQYGGLWIYPVGGLLKLAEVAGFITLTTDMAHYLNRPEDFARMYLVARGYSAFFGLVGAIACFMLGWQMTRSLLAAAGAGVGFCMLPAVVAMAHEAKPHLAGVALTLWAVWAAVRAIQFSSKAWAAAAGALAGAAVGMVLTGVLALAVVPLVGLLGETSKNRRLKLILLAGLCAAGVYGVSNPYVVKHAFASPVAAEASPLGSNLGNTEAMYTPGRFAEGFRAATGYLIEATSPVLTLFAALAVVVGFFVWLLRDRSGVGVHASAATRRAALLLGIPVVLMLSVMVAVGAGKPAEFGRFALLPAAGLMLASVVGIYRLGLAGRLGVLALTPAIVAAPFGMRYVNAFRADAGPDNTRIAAAEVIETYRAAGAYAIELNAEPAPYSMPPVDLAAWELLLNRRPNEPAGAELVVRPVDDPDTSTAVPGYRREHVLARRQLTPITWASKPFEVWVRDDVSRP